MNKSTCKSKDEQRFYDWDEGGKVLRALARTKSKASSPLRRDEREAFGVLVEESNWLGPGSLQDIIRQQY